MSHNFTDVEIKQQILWIGSAAYPLQNIAQARIIMQAPDRRAAWKRYVKAVVLWVLLGVGAGVAHSHNLHGLGDVLMFLISVLFVISTIRLIWALLRKMYYGLVIETAGPSNTVLISPEVSQLRVIVDQIMDAINNPAATFHTRIENYNDMRGARGVQVGDHNEQRNTFGGR